MKGIGTKVFEKGADEAIYRLHQMGGRVTRSMYGFRFWAAQTGDREYDIYGMTDASYTAGVINGSLIGSVRWTNHHTYYTLDDGREVVR